MPIIIPANSAIGGGYEVSNSLRFRGATAATYLKATFGATPTLATKNTISLWFKRSKFDATQQLYATNSNAANIILNSEGSSTGPTAAFYTNSGQLLGPRLYRDTSAWMHFVFAFDSTQGTAANRFKVYINGIEETSFNNVAYPAQNEASQLGVNGQEIQIGTRSNYDRIFDGYMAETAFVDGQALDPTSFGEFDEDSGVWKPIDISGLTFGNNGFYLEYKQSGTGTNASGIGADTSGNGLNFAVTNFTAIDQSTDTCTNNFATMNPLDNFYYNGVFSEGNLKIINGSGREAGATSTIALSSGKWFWEAKPKSNVAPVIGIQPAPSAANTSSSPSMQVNGFGYLKTGKVETSNGSGGSTVLASYASYVADNIIGVALDLDSSQAKIYFYKNGALQGSGVNITAPASTRDGHYFVGFGVLGGQDTFEVNFGSPPYANSSGNADGNGFGDFEYAVPSGYLAICTKNLSEALS